MRAKKKISYTIIGIIVLIITITGATYAYFALSASNSTTVTGTAANVGLVLNVEKIKPETNVVDNLIPQLESALGTAISSTYKCIDANNNAVCQVYKASLTNNGNATVKVKGTIAFSNMSNLPHLKWKIIENATTIGTNTGTTASTTATNFITEETINANQTKDYYFVVWIDEIGNIQNESGTFTATLTFTDSNGTGLTSTIGAEPASTTKYTVNVPDDWDNWTTTNPNLVWINNPIPSGIVQYDTPEAAMAALSNRPFYLKHTIKNNIVTESYVEFVVTPAMASANPGMTAGTYTLRGGIDEENAATKPRYEANVNVLKQAFGENTSYCTVYSSDVSCRVSGVGANAHSYGGVDAGDGSAYCYVDSDGSSYCSS